LTVGNRIFFLVVLSPLVMFFSLNIYGSLLVDITYVYDLTGLLIYG